MATKAKTLQVKDKEKDDKAADAPEKDSADAPSPLLDLSDAAVKKMIKQAKKRGFVTFDQLNEVLPSDTTSPEQIEDIMSMLSDMGINVSEAEEADSEDEKEDDADDTDNELVEVTQKAVTEVKKSEPGERRRNRDCQAHRGRPRGDDRGPVRKPADVPGHHHLAR
jgi:RNA polymerase primary sigma factor